MTSLVRRLGHYLLQPPDHWAPHHRRNFTTVQIGLIAIQGVHVVLIVLFSVLGVEPLVLLNATIVPFYVLVLVLHRRGHTRTTATLVTAEVVGHQILAVYLLGIQSGFQYHLVAFACGMIIFPFQNPRAKVIPPLLSMIAFVVLDMYGVANMAVIDLDAYILYAMKSVNLVVAFTILVSVVFYFELAALRSEAAVNREYERAEGLLLNILPAEIATRLKDGEQRIADTSLQTTILFADICDFTEISSTVTPEELVSDLNELFIAFDELVDERGIEKIKTIGDSYMVAAGIPQARGDHAVVVADLAFDMVRVAAERTLGGSPISIRVGIDSGASVAGVIGRRKFTYDLWGDPVNVASRMESTSEPGRVQVSQRTRDALGDAYTFESRGEVDVKGKGTMQTYFLLGRTDHA